MLITGGCREEAKKFQKNGIFEGQVLKADELKCEVSDFSDTGEHDIKQLRSCFFYEEQMGNSTEMLVYLII